MYRQKVWLKRKYDMTPEDKEKLFNEQERKCAVCKTEVLPGKKDWCVDHDHETNIVRGILCTNCNSGLGHFKDSIEILQNAIDYLNKYKSANQENPFE